MKIVKNEIDEIYTQEIQKKLVYLKQKYQEVGGKASKLLAYRLRKKQADSTLYKIKNPETKVIECQQDKFKECLLSFYQKLYSLEQLDNDTKTDSFLQSIQLPTVTDAQNNILRAQVTAEEINLAITRLKTGSFTCEWYKCLRHTLVPLLLKTYNWIIKKQEMPPSWREAVISLIPKEGKNRRM